MKNILQNLLILFAMGLCALVAFQWHREGQLRGQLQALEFSAGRDRETIQLLRGDTQRFQAEMTRTEAQWKQLSEAVAAHKQEAARLVGELQKREQLAAEVESLKAALAKANQNIIIQNEAMKRLTEERDEMTTKFNLLAADYNALVTRWNAQQEQLAAAQGARN